MHYTNTVTERIPFVLILGLAFIVGGCASQQQPPAEFIDGVNWTTDVRGQRDARTQRIAGFPCMRVDTELMNRLNTALESDDLEASKSASRAFLDEAHKLALESTSKELLRLDDDGWRELVRRYFSTSVAPSKEVRAVLSQEFQHRTDLQIWFLKEEINHASAVDDVRRVLAMIQSHIEPSIKTTRFTGAAPLAIFAAPAALARSSIHNSESACLMVKPFETVHVYRPAFEADSLLAKHAPVFVQEWPESVKYSRNADRIGRVTAADDHSIAIHVDQPTVYGYSRTIMMNGKRHEQLTYVLWYPEHPRLKGFMDPEAGKIDGATLRLTLDAQGHAAVFETLNNCGCHHRMYPMSALEQAAKNEFGPPQADKRFSIERSVEGSYDIMVTKTLDRSEGARPVVRIQAGSHAIVDVDFKPHDPAREKPVASHEYELRDYSELETLHAPGGRVVSMFLPNGLVRGAERLEGELFKPLGMLNAGQPRQRGTQLIQWDDYDFDDPNLLERTLRLPSTF